MVNLKKVKSYEKHFLDTFSKCNKFLDDFSKDYQGLLLLGVDLKKIYGDRLDGVLKMRDKIAYGGKRFEGLEDFVLSMADLMQGVQDVYLDRLNGVVQELYKAGIDTSNHIEKDLVFLEFFFTDLLGLELEEYSWWMYEHSFFESDENLKIYYKDDKEYNVESAKDFLRFHLLTF